MSRDMGANKRARYWLGDRADAVTNSQDLDDEDSDVNLWSIDGPIDEDADYGDTFCDDYADEADDESDDQDQDYKGPVRGVSEDIASRMEMDL